MEKVTLEGELRSRLASLVGEAELCDEQGRTVGFYVPLGPEVPDDLERHMLLAWAKTVFTDEELERARNDPGPSRTTAEVLERLERLG